MEKSVVKVGGMSCQHCANAITKAVSALPGVSDVAVDLKAGTVTVEHDPGKTDAARIKAEIEDQGYDAA